MAIYSINKKNRGRGGEREGEFHLWPGACSTFSTRSSPTSSVARSLARGDFWQGDCFEIMREISVSQPPPSKTWSERANAPTEGLICGLNVIQLDM